MKLSGSISQLSVAVPPAAVKSAYVRYAGCSEISHSAESPPGHIITGGVASATATTISSFPVHPLSSVTVTVYVPSVNPVWSSSDGDKPLPSAVVHEYVYGAVPPETEISIAPLLSPAQITSITR